MNIFFNLLFSFSSLKLQGRHTKVSAKLMETHVFKAKLTKLKDICW